MAKQKSSIMAVHVRYNSLYISLPFSAKQQHEMTKFCVVWRTRATTVNFVKIFISSLTLFHIQFLDTFVVEFLPCLYFFNHAPISRDLSQQCVIVRFSHTRGVKYDLAQFFFQVHRGMENGTSKNLGIAKQFPRITRVSRSLLFSGRVSRGIDQTST